MFPTLVLSRQTLTRRETLYWSPGTHVIARRSARAGSERSRSVEGGGKRRGQLLDPFLHPDRYHSKRDLTERAMYSRLTLCRPFMPCMTLAPVVTLNRAGRGGDEWKAATDSWHGRDTTGAGRELVDARHEMRRGSIARGEGERQMRGGEKSVMGSGGVEVGGGGGGR